MNVSPDLPSSVFRLLPWPVAAGSGFDGPRAFVWLGQQRVIGRVRSAFGRGGLLRERDRRAGTFQEPRTVSGLPVV